MDAGPRIDSYEWAGGREPMLRFGPEDGPVAVLALPLFEEANRTRAFGMSILRALAERGIGGVLPELPGQGENERPTNQVTLDDLKSAFAAVPGSHAVAIRSGALLADARPCWLLAPQTGAELHRELARVKSGPLDGELMEIAGNLVSHRFLNELAGASFLPGEGRGPVAMNTVGEQVVPSASRLGSGLRRGRRIVRLTTDTRPADRLVDGAALWRRAQPDNEILFAETLAADIADWIATCEG